MHHPASLTKISGKYQNKNDVRMLAYEMFRAWSKWRRDVFRVGRKFSFVEFVPLIHDKRCFDSRCECIKKSKRYYRSEKNKNWKNENCWTEQRVYNRWTCWRVGISFLSVESIMLYNSQNVTVHQSPGGCALGEQGAIASPSGSLNPPSREIWQFVG